MDIDIKVLEKMDFDNRIDSKPPLLENQLNFKYEALNNEDLLPPDLETALVPKKLLYIKLKRQRLLPTELVIRLPKIELIDMSKTRTCVRKNISVIQCHVCPKMFETVHRLKTHVSRKHMKSWLKCEKCPYKTTKKNEIKNHAKYGHQEVDEKFFVCAFCDFRGEAGTMSIHELTHKDPRECIMHACRECGFKTKFWGSLKRHELNHKKLKIPCDKCSYVAPNIDCLHTHMHTHNKVYKTCAICQKSVDQRFFRTHVVSHSAGKDDMMWCDVCDYGSLYAGNLGRHKLHHRRNDSRTKYKRCPECPYKTTESGNFKRHYKGMHCPDSNFACELCDFSSNHKSSWQQHMSTQHVSYKKRIKLKCRDCPQQYLTSKGLKLHSFTHLSPADATRYECMHCSYFSLNKQSLLKHIQAQHGEGQSMEFEKKLKCSGCKFQAYEESDMHKHIRERHGWSAEIQYETWEVPKSRPAKLAKTQHEARIGNVG